MFTTYDEALDWIHSQLKFGIKPGLERMTYMLEELGNPEHRLQSIHIAGTNGKGSTVSYIRQMLQEAGYEVGTFTSPYIEQFNERISVNGKPISDQEMLELAQVVQPIVEQTRGTEHGDVTEFEIITLMAIYYFAKVHPVDYVIFETGMGGRLDSTNVIHPLLTIITNVGFDHTEILGNTVEELTFEKAGILKPGVPAIIGVKQAEGLKVIEDSAQEKRIPLYIANKDFSVEHTGSSVKGEGFSFSSALGALLDGKIAMKGIHQVENASLALMAIYYLKAYRTLNIDESQIKSGLLKTKWIGRFECVQQHPMVIIDGAHNPEGIDSLMQTVRSHYPNKKITVLFSALGDKKLHVMVPKLEEIADQLLFTTFDYPRAIHPSMMAQHAKMEYQIYENYQEAIEQVLQSMKEDEVFIITGSLYFISLVRKLFV